MRGVGMERDTDNQRLNVDCQDCGRAVRLTPMQLRTAFAVMCPACGHDLTSRAQAILREYEREHAAGDATAERTSA